MHESTEPQPGDALPAPIPRDPPSPPGYVDPLEGSATLDEVPEDADDADPPPRAAQ
jgi:hypothetical protein